jgi:hypothetical protein
MLHLPILHESKAILHQSSPLAVSSLLRQQGTIYAKSRRTSRLEKTVVSIASVTIEHPQVLDAKRSIRQMVQ